MTAVTTLATLTTRLSEDCNRDDAGFIAAIPGFIQSAEAEMQRVIGRVRRMIGRATATINTEFELVPTDFAGVRSFELQTSPVRALEYVSPDALTGLKGQYQTSGNPVYYTIIGDDFQFLPVPGSAGTGQLIYWRKFPALSVSNTSNWLLLDHPDAYIWGSKVHAFAWLQDEGRAGAAASAFSTILADIVSNDRAESYGATMQTRTSLVV